MNDFVHIHEGGYVRLGIYPCNCKNTTDARTYRLYGFFQGKDGPVALIASPGGGIVQEIPARYISDIEE